MNDENPEMLLSAYIGLKDCEADKDYLSFGKGLGASVVGTDFLNESGEKIGYVKAFDVETGKATIHITDPKGQKYFEKEPGQFSIRGFVEDGHVQ